MKVGEKWYVITHAYHHYIGEIVEVFPNEVIVRNCIKVHSSDLDWTRFFDEGMRIDNTRFDIVPDGSKIPIFPHHGCFPWKHSIPKGKK